MKSSDIRQSFLSFFGRFEHAQVQSARLIPDSDPTLFFVNAGMVPFKRYFTGEEQAPYKRAVSSQKCLRVSGKHNDLENVGVTARHHTLFEMLGNFSFGDYFKREAIAWAWAFLTEVCGLNKKDLWVTVYQDDDEAAALWGEVAAVSPSRIVRLGEKDNFWSMGPTGPCGPCSEIHVDRGVPCDLNNPNCSVACDCDRFMEVWNLVFMQFNRDEAGILHPLPHPSIDTGMGLERLSMVLQGVSSNYDTDLFQPLIQDISRLTKKTYGANADDDISMRVLADHARATSFLIADGVLPSNEGRGYVLRRIMRRAIRHGRLLGMREPFFFKLHDVLEKEMGTAYPELKDNAAFVKKVIESEESRFLETLDRGMALLEDEIGRLQQKRTTVLSGDVGFKLYDTYGFPLDLTELILSQRGCSLDTDGFERAMQTQKNQGREAWKGSGSQKLNTIYLSLKAELPASRFTGYNGLRGFGTIQTIVKDGVAQKTATAEDQVELVLDETPFYPEGGGQVGDRGEMLLSTHPQTVLEVLDTVKPVDGLIVHRVRVKSGAIHVGDQLSLAVTESERRATMKNHTATHLLHAALRRHVGEHLKQAGSLVTPKRLRFDFSHFEPVSFETLKTIEREINAQISANLPLVKGEMPYREALDKGALAFFGDKYGDRVRVVEIAGASTELCGGTHVDHTGEIGFFKIIAEGSVASGVRRIEAVTGTEAVLLVQHLESLSRRSAELLKAAPEDVPERLEALQVRVKTLEKELKQTKSLLALGGSREAGASGGSTHSWKESIVERHGVPSLFFETNLDSSEALRSLSDEIRTHFQRGVMVLVGKADGRVLLLTAVSQDYQKRFHAGKLMQALVPLVAGKGGGRPDLAQGAGTDMNGLSVLLQTFDVLLSQGA